MFWNVFRRSPADPTALTSHWWQEADRAGLEPDRATIDRLRAATTPASAPASPDEAENQQEMIDGLDALLPLGVTGALPIVDTQHRVIGADTCHLLVPATLAGEVAVPGKIFLTSARLVFAGGRAQAWAWHRVRTVRRAGRSVLVVIAGSETAVHLQCNSYGDALLVTYVANRLTTAS